MDVRLDFFLPKSRKSRSLGIALDHIPKIGEKVVFTLPIAHVVQNLAYSEAAWTVEDVVHPIVLDIEGQRLSKPVHIVVKLRPYSRLDTKAMQALIAFLNSK